MTKNQDTRNREASGSANAATARAERLDAALDELLEGVRTSVPDAAASCARVQARLEKEGGWTSASQSVEAAVLPMEVGAPDTELRDCADYQALLPAYRAGELSEGRALLVEDHIRHCVPCRRAARAEQLVAPSEVREPKSAWRLLAAAAVILFAASASWFAWQRFLPAGQEDLMQVKSSDGQLFALQEGKLEALFPGDWVDGGQEIRTSKGGGALLELADGSRIEVNERAALEVIKRRSGYRVRVDRGDIIVEAAKQREGTLDVTTDEMLVSVKGTIFAVSHGTKGSRVSVIEGEVQVEQARKRTSLYPGDQLGSRATLTSFPLAQEIGWSGDVDRYLEMLEEFGALRESLNQVLAAAQPRYSSELLEHVPADTAVYIALPNPTATLTEIYGLIQQRMASNATLAGQWNEFNDEDEGRRIDDFVESVRELSEFLGEETVVALGFSETTGLEGDPEPVPMVLSQVENSIGLTVALEQKIAEMQAENPDFNLVLIDDATSTVPNDALYVWVGNDLLVASPALDEVQRVISGTTSGFAGSDFHAQVTAAYDRGAEYLGAVDLAALVGTHLSDVEDEEAAMAMEFTGLGTIEYLVVERSQDEERAHTAADLTFAGQRQGMAAWLAEPAGMESLEFVSANATFASAAVHKDPAMILDEIFAVALTDPEAQANFEEAQAEVGIDFRDDLAVALGGEMTVAIDGPMLPTPAWKAIVEVYDEVLLQATIETLVQRMNEEAAEDDGELDTAITLSESVGNSGRTFYRVDIAVESEQPGLSMDPSFSYAFVDGFMVAAPSNALIEQAILHRDSGASLVTSEAFQELLPRDGYVDFSAVVFNRIGETVADLASRLPMPENVTEEQQQRIDGFLEEIAEQGPSLYCFYGEPDRIRMVSNSSAFAPLGGVSSLVGFGGLAGVFGGGQPGGGI